MVCRKSSSTGPSPPGKRIRKTAIVPNWQSFPRPALYGTNWTPARMLHYIELDRYRGGRCTGDYLSRLHYLEDWLADNDRRGLVEDLTRRLGGVRVPHAAREMTVGWKSYRYLRSNPSLLGPLRRMEERVTENGLAQIPKNRVAAIEPKLQSGDIIGIVSRDGRKFGTSHVGLAYRGSDGALHFMHASSPRNYGRVVVDSQLSQYLYRYGSHTGILVARPLRYARADSPAGVTPVCRKRSGRSAAAASRRRRRR